MNEPRKPIFGFLWPKPDPDAPVDDAFVQVRPVRVVGRGPVRIVALGVLSAITVIGLGSALMSALVTGALVPTIVAAGVAATATFVLLRGWVVGTYVSDEAVRIETVLRRREVPWAEVASVDLVEGRCPFLGTPIWVSGSRSMLRTRTGVMIATHVYSTSPDLWLRAEAFDMARLRLEHWAGR